MDVFRSCVYFNKNNDSYVASRSLLPSLVRFERADEWENAVRLLERSELGFRLMRTASQTIRRDFLEANGFAYFAQQGLHSLRGGKSLGLDCQADFPPKRKLRFFFG